MSPTAFSYNGTSFQTANIMIDSVDHGSLPTITANMIEIDHANASAIPFLTYPSKTITVTGTIFGSSVTDLDSRVDTFKGGLVGIANNLDIGYGGSTRRYIATVTAMTMQRPGNLTQATFSITFLCTSPFGVDTTTTTLLNVSGRTLSTFTDTPTFGGNAPYQYPVFTITFTALTGATSGTVSIGNNNTGQQVNVLRSWNANDVLVIDATQFLNTPGVSQPVTVNGLAADYSGAVPLFPPGASSIIYIDNFATRTFNYSITNVNRYL